MKNVLLVVFTGIEQNGVCNYFRQWIKNTPTGKFSYTFYCFENIKDPEMYNELKSLGVNFVEGNCRISNDSIIGKFRRYKQLRLGLSELIKDGDYDILHIAAGYMNYAAVALQVAKKHKVKSRIYYATNNPENISIFKRVIRFFSRKIIVNSANVLSSCSKRTAKYVFGDASDKAVIINPCADSKKFVFSKDIRDEYRKKYGIENNFVVGNMARFDPQKNHKFLIEIFKEITNMDDNARLMLVGWGELEDDMRKQVSDYGITDKVIFCGSTDHPQDYFCAMDAFVFPCIYEGLGQVAIHAQNSGLKTLCSEEVPKETKITELIEYMSLTESPKKWAEKILSYNNGYERRDMSVEIIKADYDISSIPKLVNRLYSD